METQEQARRQLEPRETPRGQIQIAGTQALPVATNTADAAKEPVITAGPRAPDTGDAVNHAATRGPGVENGASTIQKPKRGRPNLKNFNKAEYNVLYMRKKRARIKAEKEAGK